MDPRSRVGGLDAHLRASMVVVAVVAGVLALCPPPASASSSDFCMPSTELAQELPGDTVKVSLREVEGSAAKEGCALGVIEAPAAQVFAVLSDAGRFPEFMPHVQVSEVETTADGEILNHQVLDLPFPISNRHYTIRLQRYPPPPQHPDRWEITWTYVPGSGNVNENRGGWSLLALAADRTLAAYRVHTDPAGFIPKWALTRVTRKTLPNVIEAVRRRVGELYGDTAAAGGGGLGAAHGHPQP